MQYSCFFIFQLMLTLPPRPSFSVLMDKLTTELMVSAERLRVKCGFPPKLLEPNTATAGEEGGKGEEEVLPIQHGDRLSVEILPDPNARKLLAVFHQSRLK